MKAIYTITEQKQLVQIVTKFLKTPKQWWLL
jgi:hypothetical protein